MCQPLLWLLTCRNKIRIQRLDTRYWQKLVLSMRTLVTINARPNLEQRDLATSCAGANARTHFAPRKQTLLRHHSHTRQSKPKHKQRTVHFRNNQTPLIKLLFTNFSHENNLNSTKCCCLNLQTKFSVFE